MGQPRGHLLRKEHALEVRQRRLIPGRREQRFPTKGVQRKKKRKQVSERGMDDPYIPSSQWGKSKKTNSFVAADRIKKKKKNGEEGEELASKKLKGGGGRTCRGRRNGIGSAVFSDTCKLRTMALSWKRGNR